MAFGKYELQEVLGEGSFGVVYKAIDLALDRTIALKVLHPSLLRQLDLLERFKHEAKLAAQLMHPNIVPIYDFGQFEGQNFIAMGYMPGGSLRDLLQKKAPLDEEEAYSIFNQLINGVAFAHSKGIVHRDLKPNNILFDEEGRARISDMGFAKAIRVEDSHSMSMSGGIVGTPHYMAPELWEGKSLTPAADQYSLGCILYEMLSGEKLFDGETTPTVMMKHFKPIEFKAHLTPKSAAIITRMTAKEPEARFASLVEVHNLILRIFDKSENTLDDAVFIPIITPSVKYESESGKDNNAQALIEQEGKLIPEDEQTPKPKFFENAKIRLALIALLAVLLLSSLAFICSNSAWFIPGGPAKTATAQAQALTLTQNWLEGQPTVTNTATQTKTPTKTRTKIPTKTPSRTPTLTLTPTLTRQMYNPPTSAPSDGNVIPPNIQPSKTPVVPTNTPVIPTNTPFVPTNTPFVPTQKPPIPYPYPYP